MDKNNKIGLISPGTASERNSQQIPPELQVGNNTHVNEPPTQPDVAVPQSVWRARLLGDQRPIAVVAPFRHVPPPEPRRPLVQRGPNTSNGAGGHPYARDRFPILRQLLQAPPRLPVDIVDRAVARPVQRQPLRELNMNRQFQQNHASPNEMVASQSIVAFDRLRAAREPGEQNNDYVDNNDDN